MKIKKADVGVALYIMAAIIMGSRSGSRSIPSRPGTGQVCWKPACKRSGREKCSQLT